TAIMERLCVPRRIVTVVEGESLVNDAIALVAYEFAVNAFVTGSFSLAQASWKFVVVGVGGILMGLAIGWLSTQAQKRIEDPPVQITISILTAFAAYIAADQLGLSGVLAVVTAGLYIGWRSPEIIGSRVRLQAGPVWEMIGFLLNGIVFILIGLQLPAVWNGLAGLTFSKVRLCIDALLICALTIVVRFVWVFAATYLPRYFSKSLRERDPYPAWQPVAIVAWAGMRGVVSLAAALALPAAILNGSSSQEKSTMVNVIIFFTYVVILVTLVFQGLTLPLLIRWLNVTGSGETEREERDARLKANLAAIARLAELEQRNRYPEELLRRLRLEYEDRIRQLESFDESADEQRRSLYSSEFAHLEQEALDVERRTIIRLRNERVINDVALRRIQHDIDLAEARLGGRD
ncbi:MAG TPA: Na+/H+ antiporter, partial [Verrucomicrobiae bacterium]|nr:Na+/H+ antiporter [Verrucomicrobiae bacterium]